jgi:hypothetical protein
MNVEYVDILTPPRFEPSGVVKPVVDAIKAGDWLGVMNLWIVRPGPALLYQERPPGGWAPGKLDGSVGGYYRASESGLDGLREAEEELGWKCPEGDVTLIGRHLSVGVDEKGRERRLVVTVFMTYCDLPLAGFTLDPKEVPAIYEIPLANVVKALSDRRVTFTARGLSSGGQPVERVTSGDDFSYVFGGYHLRIAQIAKKFAEGQRVFCY